MNDFCMVNLSAGAGRDGEVRGQERGEEEAKEDECNVIYFILFYFICTMSM